MKEHSIFYGFLSVLYPSFCINCGKRTDNPYPLCDLCMADIKEIEPPYCNICGKPLPSGVNFNICGSCISSRPPFKMARSGYIYRDVLKKVIHEWKYAKKRSFSKFVDIFLEKALLKSDLPVYNIDMISFVPISKSKLKNRGFNQVEDISKYISIKFNIPLFKGIRKKEGFQDQTLLSRNDRLRNVKGAFYLSEALPKYVKNLLIIDDVYTTGATVSEISSLIFSHRKDINIYIFTFSRGVQ